MDWLDAVGPIASLDSLPPPDTKRWVIRRKAEVVAAVRAGILTLEEACRRYTLSIEEFLSWQRLRSNRESRTALTSRFFPTSPIATIPHGAAPARAVASADAAGDERCAFALR